ncbi:guanitoxin biosynthesis L-arginine gamma (S) hydroxylase [Burkholderia ubonensis]|uniref:guanitoxin biosynthesis L-arginine gamma (S) hydroxylase n=1 Tax=Burkholderia ubonensis TaxID=101571 RepID=UPI00075D198D|nr:guanitoxin biosynthesis L-arginine gamma (S) hydroxylase [Burkholderia ubonensis]KVW36493.1 fatty acid desaturase [Burkholderia ubonensis]
MLAKHEFSDEIVNRLKDLYGLNNWRAPVGFAADCLVIAAAVAATKWNVWVYPLALLVIGSRQRALASLLHEACHRTLARNRRMNDILGRWCAGFPVFQSYDAYRGSHVKNHHAFLGDVQRDPDYINYLETGLFDVRDRLDFVANFVVKTLFLANVGGYLKYLARNRLGGIFANKSELIGLCAVHAVLFVVFYLVWGSFGYIIFWVVPFLTSYQVIGWFSEISEHYPIIETRRNALTATRNRFPAWIESIFIGMHGDNYHLVHHLFAGIPYWNLSLAHRVLMSDPQYAAINNVAGGIFFSPAGRRSVVHSILDEIGAKASGGFQSTTRE